MFYILYLGAGLLNLFFGHWVHPETLNNHSWKGRIWYGIPAVLLWPLDVAVLVYGGFYGLWYLLGKHVFGIHVSGIDPVKPGRGPARRERKGRIRRTYAAGCCENQGAIPTGWQMFFFGQEIMIRPEKNRPHCGDHPPR